MDRVSGFWVQSMKIERVLLACLLVALGCSNERISAEREAAATANWIAGDLRAARATSRSFSMIAKLGLITVLNIETCRQGIVYEDADVVALGELKRLRYLNLNGGASPEALMSLQSQLPECFISDLK